MKIKRAFTRLFTDNQPTPPASVTILACFVLFITSWHAIRIYGALTTWQIMAEFGANPAYILATGILWVFASLWLFRVLWEGRRYAFRAGWISAGVYFVWYWVDRLVIQANPAPNTLFSLVGSGITLAVFGIILSIPASRAFLTATRPERNKE